MTAREPSAVEVIAEALKSFEPSEYEGNEALMRQWRAKASSRALAALKAAGFVVATRDEIRAMSPSEQAELIGGTVRAYRARRIYEKPPLNGYDGSHMHVVGPWREVRDV